MDAGAFHQAEGADVFFHLAWEGARDDFAAQYKNIDMTLRCLRATAHLGCKRFVCTGSQAEYGCTREFITEETPLKPTTAYGACKCAAFYLVADLARKLGLEYTWARVFSVYGPNDNPNTLIMTLMRDCVLNGNARLLTNGEQVWNYLYESDAARALRLLGSSPIPNEVYNVAGRTCAPLSAFVETLKEAMHTNASIRYGEETGPVNLNVSVEKLTAAIGEYEHTDFAAGIQAMLMLQNN